MPAAERNKVRQCSEARKSAAHHIAVAVIAAGSSGAIGKSTNR
jgi:hypothetical protein